MTESPQQFGPHLNLVGVLTQPASPAPTPRVAFLLFNAGVIPRIGPHRMNVKIARALAEQDQLSFRFDLAGQGDSRRAAGDGGYLEQGVLDLGAAMDHLQSTLGIHRFALIGICSGAVSAYWAGLADRRVVAVLMFDGFWYRTRWTRWVRDWKRFRAASPSASWAAIRRRLGLRFDRSLNSNTAQTLFSESNCPTREEFSRGMQTLVTRQVAILQMYSASVIDYYSYSAQFRHVFGGEPWFAKVRCTFRQDIDHSFVALASQQKMLVQVLEWLPEVLQAAEARP